jgi:hypothetical protein
MLANKDRTKFIAFVAGLLMIAAIHDEIAAQLPTFNDGGRKRALMIGINDYRAVPKLQGSLNDIETIKQVLITRWGFEESNIQSLVNEKATRDDILAALKQFVSETKPLDTIYIHYSGHGSQVADLNGDEQDDKLDETIVPYDGRTPSVPDITDDELDIIFSRLPTKNALIVFDSCHSGTATRSVNVIRTRAIPQDTRIDLYRQLASRLDSRVLSRGSIQTLTSPYVLMTGAAAYQEALDGPIEGRFHGFFSYALARSLSSSPSTATARQIFRGVEAEFRRIQTHFGRAAMPEPQLEAPTDLLDKPLWQSPPGAATSGGEARLGWLDVKAGEGGELTLVRGVIMGAVPGSTWAIHPPGDTLFAPGHALAVATVGQIDGKDAKAKYRPPGIKIPDHSRAVASLPAPAQSKIPIRILDTSVAKSKRIEEVLAREIPEVVFVPPDEFSQYLIDQADQEIRLLTADGLQVVGAFDEKANDWGSGLARMVLRIATASELLALDNPSSELKIELRATQGLPLSKPIQTTRGISVLAANTLPVGFRIRTPGQPRARDNSLQIELTINMDAYVTIVDVDSEGSIHLLFPNDYVRPQFYPNGLIRAGATAIIPDSLQKNNNAGFYWDYGPPQGIDTIRVFATTDIETAYIIRRRVRYLQTNDLNTRRNRGERRLVDDFRSIRDDLTPNPDTPQDTSRLEKLPGSVQDWSASSITIKVGR